MRKVVTKITKVITSSKEYNDTYLFYGNSRELEYQLNSCDTITLKNINDNKNMLFNVLFIEAIEYSDAMYRITTNNAVDMDIIKNGIAELILDVKKKDTTDFKIDNINKELQTGKKL